MRTINDASCIISAIFSGGAGGARAPPEFGGSEKGQSLISAYRSLAITMNTPGFKKLNTALLKVQLDTIINYVLYHLNLVVYYITIRAP